MGVLRIVLRGAGCVGGNRMRMMGEVGGGVREVLMKVAVEVREVGLCGWRWRLGWGGRGGGC